MKKIAFVLPGMKGGGAERVAALLANAFTENGIDVRFFLTHSKRDQVIRCDLSEHIPLMLFDESMPDKTVSQTIYEKLLWVLSSLLCKPFEWLKKPVPADFAKLSLLSQYSREIRFLRGLMQGEPDLTVIAFLQPAIPIALLAARGLPNRVVISERGNPERLMRKRYGKRFIEKYYTRADAVVFQTEGAKNTYPACVAEKGTVIPNPIKPDLPAPYHGERNKVITTFCRISPEKDLINLLRAFETLHRDHSDYHLRIIGDAQNAVERQIMTELKQFVSRKALDESVAFEPYMETIHQSVIKDAFYVNSSYTEGLCNAMLEAMAIGLPVICTDCPIGGARATITDGENGLLVPIKDPTALSKAMVRIIEQAGLSEKLAENASELREQLSLEKTAGRWIDLLDDGNVENRVE